MEELDTEWGGAHWIPDDVRRGSRLNGVTQEPSDVTVLHMRAITTYAQNQGLSLPSLWGMSRSPSPQSVGVKDAAARRKQGGNKSRLTAEIAPRFLKTFKEDPTINKRQCVQWLSPEMVTWHLASQKNCRAMFSTFASSCQSSA